MDWFYDLYGIYDKAADLNFDLENLETFQFRFKGMAQRTYKHQLFGPDWTGVEPGSSWVVWYEERRIVCYVSPVPNNKIVFVPGYEGEVPFSLVGFVREIAV